MVPLEAVDEHGEPVEGVRLEPAETIATGTLREERVTKRVRAVLRLNGSPGDGYRIADSSVTPSSFRVRGPQSALKALDRIDIPFSVDGLRGSVRRRVTLELPAGVVPVNIERALVDVTIVPRREAAPGATAVAPITSPTTSPPALSPTAPPATVAPAVAPTPLARRAD